MVSWSTAVSCRVILQGDGMSGAVVIRIPGGAGILARRDRLSGIWHPASSLLHRSLR